jgi:hypothetical protein
VTATAKQQQIAADYKVGGVHVLVNVDLIARAAAAAGLPFHVACALMERESGGRNTYGADKNGMAEGFPDEVNEANYRLFIWMVAKKGRQSNGVGPSQITYRGFFPQMVAQGLKPWDPYDNMVFGMRLLAGYFKASDSWQKAGKKYNGSSAYGRGLVKQIAAWHARVGG